LTLSALKALSLKLLGVNEEPRWQGVTMEKHKNDKGIIYLK
jgi:hypothetical protein